MRECKHCRHCRTFPLLTNNAFARCVAPKTRGSRWSYCFTHRLFDACEETDCGSEGRFFEPIPLGMSHGIDWDRAARTAETIAEMRAFVVKTAGARLAFMNHRPIVTMTYRVTVVRQRFTVAEYLAALTTDYCAARAAE